MKRAEEGRRKADDVNVFVKYLPQEINDFGLRMLFSSCGRIISAKVMVNKGNGQSLGFGFIRFSSPEEAERATKTMDGRRVGNKVLMCKFSEAAYPDPTDNLFIKILPLSFTEDQLKELFSPFGQIVALTILKDKSTGLSKQTGFVRYQALESATDAVEKMNGTRLAPDLPPLIVKYAEPDSKPSKQKSEVRSRPSLPSPSIASPPAFYPPTLSYYEAPEVPSVGYYFYNGYWVPCYEQVPSNPWPYPLPLVNHPPLVVDYSGQALFPGM